MNNPIVIETKHLNKSFNGKPAVIDVALTVRQGEVCGFLGPNGSGKTTTLRMLCGLLTPDSGEGHCLGFDIITQSYEIKQQVGYMTQRFSLYHDLSAYENLDFISRVFNLKNRKQKIDHFLKMFNLEDRRHQLAGTLSGGMQQRLALAGCLLHEPKLLLLDEPTGGVDPKVRREFWDEIFILSEQGITTLVSTHYMDEALRCNRLVYIAYGHLLATGTADAIVEKSALHTWVATGKRLFNLSEHLKKSPDIEQVAFFGDNLHVSGKNETQLKQAIMPFQHDYHWEKVQPSIEDVFINLVKNAEKEL